MTNKFQNKYRIPSARLQTWDYSANAPYFITICTAHRKPYFGDIKNGIMQLSEMGKVVETEWQKTFEMRPDMNLQKGVYIVMPNHFHAIITIGENQYNKLEKKNTFSPQSKNLASIIRGFKIGVTSNARKTHVAFDWQPRFYEHIIKNDTSYQHIHDYILTNPEKWEQDKFYNIV